MFFWLRLLQPRFLAWLGLIGVLGTLVAPTSASADAFSAWSPGPDAMLDNTYEGYIDQPTMNASVATGNFNVTGWFVDTQAQGWAGADDIEVWLGTMDGGGTMLAKAAIGENRPDVAAALGNPYFAPSGFSAVVPANALSAGQQTLSVYAHTPDKGWWYSQVQVNVSATAPQTAPAAAPGPVVSGGALPTVVIQEPKSGDSLSTQGSYQIIGYALDQAAAPNQGIQGTGIDHVYAYMDAEPENGGTALGDATLAFADSAAAAAYGPQFDNAGWRLTFKPTQFHSGTHTLFVYAHSVVTGKTGLATVSFGIQK
jgi:hypothetical protein